MRLNPPPTATAWAPWLDGQRDWLLDRDQRAVTWLIDRARHDGSPIVVQATSHADDHKHGDGPLAQLAKVGKVATYRSPVGHGATFAHMANIRLLATAMRTAAGHSLVVTELPSVPLDGWAMAMGAIDLSTSLPTPDTRSDEQREMLETFVDQLYNGWAHKQVGRRASAYYLPKLAESGLSYAQFLGAVLAIDPGHLDSNSDIAEMERALPSVWREQRSALARF